MFLYKSVISIKTANAISVNFTAKKAILDITDALKTDFSMLNPTLYIINSIHVTP